MAVPASVNRGRPRSFNAQNIKVKTSIVARISTDSKMRGFGPHAEMMKAASIGR